MIEVSENISGFGGFCHYAIKHETMDIRMTGACSCHQLFNLRPAINQSLILLLIHRPFELVNVAFKIIVVIVKFNAFTDIEIRWT